LTPAVYAATRKAGAPPLPYLLICAFVANAASFVLPISNPANLVIYGAHLPALPAWLAQYGVPSLAAIVLTFLVLRHTQRASLTGRLTAASAGPGLSSGGKLALAGIVATAATLLATSALGRPLGLPTAIAGGLTGLAIVLARHKGPWPILRQVSWSIVPLVAGLFVIARAIENTDVLQPLVRLLAAHAVDSPRASELVAGSAVALVSNLVNNLPLGLIASTLASGAHVTPGISGALLIGVDLGPNLSVTGSLATILWLSALRREGLDITPLKFLALGSMLMPPALLAALVSLGRFA
jgi:arsenical pump membrane protein